MLKRWNFLKTGFYEGIKVALETLFEKPSLSLQDFGGSLDSGAFRFKKGSIDDFHYKNLSGGEKAAFDLLLDIFVKRDEYQDAIYCIDEPRISCRIRNPWAPP